MTSTIFDILAAELTAAAGEQTSKAVRRRFVHMNQVMRRYTNDTEKLEWQLSLLSAIERDMLACLKDVMTS